VPHAELFLPFNAPAESREPRAESRS